MSSGSGDSLFQFTAEDYGGSFKADLLEQYKLYVQSAGERECPSGSVKPLSADPQCRLGGSVRIPVGGLRAELLGAGRSSRRDTRISALVLDHKVARGPQPGEVRRHPRV